MGSVAGLASEGFQALLLALSRPLAAQLEAQLLSARAALGGDRLVSVATLRLGRDTCIVYRLEVRLPTAAVWQVPPPDDWVASTS